MTMPLFDQIFAGLQFAFSSYYPIIIMLFLSGIVLLSAIGWTSQLATVLMFGAIFMMAWAGFATYGLIAIAILFVTFVLMSALWVLFVR